MQKISTPIYISSVLLLVFGGLLSILLIANRALPDRLIHLNLAIHRTFHQDSAGDKIGFLCSLMNRCWFILVIFSAVIGLAAHHRLRLAWLLYFIGLTSFSAYLIDGVLLPRLFYHHLSCFDPALAGMHYQKRLKDTLYSFASAQTADAFAIFLFQFLIKPVCDPAFSSTQIQSAWRSRSAILY